MALRHAQILKIVFICSVLSFCFCSTCNPPPNSSKSTKFFIKYLPKEAEFKLGDTTKFNFEIINVFSDGDNRILIHYKKKERANDENPESFYSVSEDGGMSFESEQPIPALTNGDQNSGGFKFFFIKNGIAATITKNKNIFYTRKNSGETDWTIPVQINDEQRSIHSGGNLLQPNENEIFYIWADKRRGFPLVYFSASHDGGKSWSLNQPLEYDFREGMQEAPQIVLGANNRLLVFWTDWRNQKTLADIRYSYSDDGGKHWSPSEKINDDQEEVWQINFCVAAKGSEIFIAFSDFREKGEENDNDWNVYFSRSLDNGTTWEKNIRLNDIKQGRNAAPKMSVDKAGNLYCLWWTTHETLFGQLAFSYSMDKGVSWSPSITLTDKNEIIREDATSMISINNEKLFYRYVKERYDIATVFNSSLEKTAELLDSKPQQIPDEEKISPVKFEIGKRLFADDFSNSAENWEEVEGLWMLVDGTYMGVNPDAKRPFTTFAKFNEPEQYALRGRFKLDPVAHTSATIYFRGSQSNLKHYVINNRFRFGAWLSLKNDELPNGLHILGGEPLKQKRFSFQNNRWYEFTLIVMPDRIDYYVDGQLMLSHSETLILPKGKIGIGGFYYSPTYFDDISVSELTK